MFKSQSRKYGRHRSLVRLIGTALPLKPCQRTYSQILYSENKYGSNLRCKSEPIDFPDEGPNDFDTWSRDLKNNAPDVISSITFSTPKEVSTGRNQTNEISAEKFAALEEQVLQLQADIAKILSAQLLRPITDSGSTTPSEESSDNGFRIEPPEEKIEKDAVHSTAAVRGMPPIPPPPPPPPLPSLFSLPPIPPIENQSLTDQINLYSKNQSNIPSHKRAQTSSRPPGMEEVLKNIGTVKLRRVERSPGGTPLRRRPLSPPRDDPAALLAAALRRRFAHMRPDESSPERPLMNSSNQTNFSELSSNSLEDMDQISFTRSPQDLSNLGR